MLRFELVGVAGEQAYHLTESEETLVNATSLLDHRLPFTLCFFEPLATSQIDE